MKTKQLLKTTTFCIKLLFMHYFFLNALTGTALVTSLQLVQNEYIYLSASFGCCCLPVVKVTDLKFDKTFAFKFYIISYFYPPPPPLHYVLPLSASPLALFFNPVCCPHPPPPPLHRGALCFTPVRLFVCMSCFKKVCIINSSYSI